MIDDKEDNILYELLIDVEWPVEPEIIGSDFASQGGSIFYRALATTPRNIWKLTFKAIQLICFKNTVSSNLSRILNSGSEWHLGVGAQGAVIAVLQNTSLEIRAKKDEFSSVVGKISNLYSDPFPSWRKISWSSECSMVAVAYSNGAVEIFNTVGASLFTIYPPRYQEGELQVDTSNALVALIFSDARTQKIKWAAELIMVDFFGNIRGYFVSPSEGYQESHNFSLNKLYSSGISAAIDIGSLIVVAGSCKYLNDQKLRNNGVGHGLSIWRMNNDYPYYKQVPSIDEEEYMPPSESLINHIPGFKAAPNYDCIFRLCASPLGRQIAALHTSGSISIWDIPSLRKRKFWPLKNQPDFHIKEPFSKESTPRSNFEVESNSVSDIKNHIADVQWWSESAVIVARFSGAVSICSSNSFINLLGESPEFFEGVPQISAAYERSFLGLEMERQIIKNYGRIFTNTLDSSEKEESFDDSELFSEDLSLIQRYSTLFQRLMYWITDAERFRPEDKRSKMVSCIGRLLCLKSVSPLELFTRKIENEEYGEALALAQKYNLDCDLVYQKQWHKNPVTVITIHDYLAKIKKRSWVLEECMTRVPDDIDAARDLIVYGLRGTELDTIVAIGKGENTDEFVVSDLSLDYEEDYDLSPIESEKKAQEWAAEDIKKRLHLISQIDFQNLTNEQIKVIKARQKLLRYYDRLGTYEILLGGPHLASENYDSKFYEKFRGQSEIGASVDFARSYNWKGVDVMLTYHGDVTLPHRLRILSNFPPTMNPFKYRSLLPECDLSDEVFDCESESLREADWSEDDFCRKAVGIEADYALVSLYESNPQLQRFNNVNLTVDLISEWYQQRAREIERNSHFVDVSVDLLKLGIERNVQGLEDLMDAFVALEVIVYEVGLQSLSLLEFEAMADLEKLKLILSTSTLETLIQNLRRWGMPFLNICDKKQCGLGNKLLCDYVVSCAKEDLSIPLIVLQFSKRDQPDALIKDSMEAIKVALECIYACEKETQLPRAFAILESLPARHVEDNSDLSKVHDLLDCLEDHLAAAELLSSHGILVSPNFVKNVQEDEAQIKLLLTRLSRTASRKENSMSYEDWNKLLSDMLELQQKVFNTIEPQICFEILTESLLTSGNKQYIDFAKGLLDTKVDGSPIHNPYLQQLPYSRAVRLVIKAATEYFNSSESYFDSDMELARYCLNLIESENEDINKEMDLISSLEILPSIGLNKLPLQVRLCEDRLSLIEEALKKGPSNHLYGSRILCLADMLRVCEDDQRLRKAKVLSLVAEAAFETGDLLACGHWCSVLISGGYSEGWEICARLGKSPENSDLKQRAKLLKFALTHSTDSRIEELLATTNEIELGLLYEKVSHLIDPVLSPESDDGFEDARANQSDIDVTDEDWSDSRTESVGAASPPATSPTASSSGLLRLPFNVTKSVLSATAATTSSIVSNVANKKLWKNAASWLRPLRGDSAFNLKVDAAAEVDSNSNFEKQGCHAFYADLCPNAHISELGVSYKSYGPPLISNPALEVSLNLLRIALIEETLSQGNNCQTNITVLREVAKGILHEDLVLGLSLLLLLSAEDGQEVLSSIPRTEISLQISLYYYALQIYTYLYPFEGSGVAPVFLHPPMDVVNGILIVIESNQIPKYQISNEIQFYVDQFRIVHQMTADFVQGQALQKLGAGVNIERFLIDPQYKKDSVLGLAMSTDLDVLNLSISLAKKYNVHLWEVYMTHLQFLFDSNLETEKLKLVIEDRKLMENLASNPDDFVASMEKDILFSIGGLDHERLLLYYSLLNSVTVSDALKAKCNAHLQLLEEIRQIAKDLNYKSLISSSSSSDIIHVLKVVLTSKNVSSLADVISRLPRSEGEALDPSIVFCAWAQKHFFDSSLKKSPRTTAEWVRRYDETHETLNKMKACDVKRLIESFVFSTETSNVIPVEARKEIIKKAASFCKTKMDAAKSDVERSDWSGVFTKVGKLESHLDLLKSETFLTLSKSADDKLRRYAQQFAMTGGEEDALQRLSQSVLESLSSIDTLRSLLSVFPDEAAQPPEDIFMEVFRKTLSKLTADDSSRCEANKVLDSEFATASEILSHLLKEFKEYSEEGGELLQEDELMEELRTFSMEDKNSHDSRTAVLSIAQKYLLLSEDDERQLRTLRTGGILNSAFSSPPSTDRRQKKDHPEKVFTESPKKVTVKTDQVDSEEGRKELLETLLLKINSLKKAHSIIELLKVWPPFAVEAYDSSTSNPWSLVITKLLNRPNPKERTKEFWLLILTTASKSIANKQMPLECIDDIVDKIIGINSPEGLLVAAKLALLSNSKTSFENVIKIYKIMNQIELGSYDDELLSLVVQNEAVHHLLPTCLHGPLVTFLSDEPNKLLKESAIKQLRSANYKLEAASLSAYSSSIPRSLKTASNILNSFKSWL